MAKCNILYLGLLRPHPGGAAVWASGLLPSLSDIGHGIAAIAPLPNGVEFDDRRFTRAGMSVTRYSVPYFDTDPFSNPDRSFYHRQSQKLLDLAAHNWAELDDAEDREHRNHRQFAVPARRRWHHGRSRAALSAIGRPYS